MPIGTGRLRHHFKIAFAKGPSIKMNYSGQKNTFREYDFGRGLNDVVATTWD